MKLVSWQSVLTEHQVHLMRALRERLQGDLLVVTGVQELAERREQGWTKVKADDLPVCLIPQHGWWTVGRGFIDSHPGAFHLFGGIFADRRFFPLMLYAQYRGIRTALMSEPYAESAVSYFGGESAFSERIRCRLRPLLYRLAGLLIGRRLNALFPISSLAAEQFKDAGLAKGGSYPFGYFLPQSPQHDLSDSRLRTPGTARLIFVGSLIERKGLGLMLEAIRTAHASLGGRPFKLLLDIYGPGRMPAGELPAGVQFKGVIPFGEAQSVISSYDALILPSLHDGWGVVVNEALLQGVPAIVSDAVGAKALVLKAEAGSVFKAGDPASLARVFVNLAEDPDSLTIWEEGAKRMSASLDPTVAADYLLACLEHAKNNEGVRPPDPWYP